MGKMLAYEAFSKLYQKPIYLTLSRKSAPRLSVAVGSLFYHHPTIEDMLVSLGMDTEWWNDLSNTMKEQIDNRVSVQSVISTINERVGTDKIAFSSVYFAS